MATTTPNFGWPVPTSTDLVKDGATAIEALGDSIDASLLDLKGGTTGQVLSKNSNTDMDFTWVTDAAGDITGVTAGTGISGGGTSGTVTVTNSMATAIDAKGDLIAGTAADTFSRLAVGANGTVLTADSSEATGIKWASAAGAIQVFTVNDTQASGTQGGTMTSGAWRTRTLNTTIQNTISGASLASNQITLPAGTYYVMGIAPAYQVENNSARFYNITDSSAVMQGNNQLGGTTTNAQQMATVSATFTIASSKVFELQHYSGQTKSVQGFGAAGGLGISEIYSSVTIVKVA